MCHLRFADLQLFRQRRRNPSVASGTPTRVNTRSRVPRENLRAFSPSCHLSDKRQLSDPECDILFLAIGNLSQGGLMANETVEQKLARLEAENKSLKEQMEDRKPGQLRLKISEKGGLSVYGLGRFPVTLYKEQWARLLEQGETIKKFLKEHDQELKAKQ